MRIFNQVFEGKVNTDEVLHEAMVKFGEMPGGQVMLGIVLRKALERIEALEKKIETLEKTKETL